MPTKKRATPPKHTTNPGAVLAEGLAPRPVAPCTLCACDSEGEIFGYKVCAYHLTHGEDAPPCPNCNQDGGSDSNG